MKSPITTHVLDTSLGKPAAGVAVQLDRLADGEWLPVAQGTTDTDGRIMNLLPADQPLPSETYRLTFLTADYFRLTKRESIYPKISVEFNVSTGQHYHIPLLVSPFGYTTYRGS
jgi:5-hydroxyisourate hydrolase